MNEVFWDEIESLEYIDPKDLENTEFVYDFSVEDVETFATKDGLIVHNTLNTFHHAGVSAKSNVNQGVPRIRELISVTKNPSTPSLTIYLKKESNSNKDFAKKVLNEIEELKFLYFIESTDIFYDNKISNTITGDQSFLNDYYNFHQDVKFENISPWVLKIKISDLYLLNKNSSMFELYSFLIRKYDNLHIIYSDDNSNSLFFHIR